MILNAFSPRLSLATFYRKFQVLAEKFMNRNDDPEYSLYPKTIQYIK